RVRQAVVATRNVRLFPELGIPVSTARTWLTRGSPRVVSAANNGPDDVPALRAEIAVLRAKAEMYLAIASVLLVIIRGFRVDLGATRVPLAIDKAKLLRAIKVASRYATLHRILGLIGLSPSRYHVWNRRKLVCELDDQSSCPRSRPMQLTANEVQVIKEHVLDPKLRHMTVRSSVCTRSDWARSSPRVPRGAALSVLEHGDALG